MRRAIVAAVLACVLSPQARGAQVVTRQGEVLTVTPARKAHGILPLHGEAHGALTYELRDASGEAVTGVVAGTDLLDGANDPMLARLPGGDDVFLVFSGRQQDRTDVGLSAWTGRSWLPPTWITDDSQADAQPHLTLLGDGTAVLAWRRTALGRVQLRHLEVTSTGDVTYLAYLDVGLPQAFLRPEVGDVELPTGLAGTFASEEGELYVVLADAPANDVAVLRILLGTNRGGSGVGASPVPVTITMAYVPTAAGPGTDWSTRSSERASGKLMDVSGVRGSDWQGLYWREGEEAVAAIFRGGAPLRLIEVPARAATTPASIERWLLREMTRDGMTASGRVRSRAARGRED